MNPAAEYAACVCRTRWSVVLIDNFSVEWTLLARTRTEAEANAFAAAYARERRIAPGGLNEVRVFAPDRWVGGGDGRRRRRSEGSAPEGRGGRPR